MKETMTMKKREGAGHSYTVKDWFANKIAQEKGTNISICNVFAILKETEKAVKALVDLGSKGTTTTWIPKSALAEEDGYETLRIEDWEEAYEEWKYFHSHFE